ncbi:MAG: orotidine-5'-phosphate decarboxylase [Bacteroidetes bacterium]|nr:orotidine-5'-phosphate decarboxylase [Bacteroidota bacterium]
MPSHQTVSFLSKLHVAQTATGTVLCVGLDPDLARLPDSFHNDAEGVAVREFCTSIVEATAPYACAFKPNLAFFEALGADGWQVLADVIEAIPDDRLIILDAKRGDIGNSAAKYAHALYAKLGGDAVTVAPYMGRDAIVPFLQDEERCAFVLAATSNPSAVEVQQLQVGDELLYKRVARMAVEAGVEHPGTVGLVVGATRPELLAELRTEHPQTPFLVPGVGAQGGSAEAVLEANAGGPVLINSSRGILYASRVADFAEAAGLAAQELAKVLPA